MLETEVNGDGVGDEDPVIDSDDEDEIAGDVATSDAAVVTDVIRDAETSIRLDPLPVDDVNIGRVSIAKVSILEPQRLLCDSSFSLIYIY